MVEAILRTQNISKSFGALKASDNISIDLKPGEIHAIIGPNGAGKSTLIAQICGSLKPDQGKIEFLGHDISTASPQARAQLGLGRTFQISQVAMEDTVLQNVVLGAIGASKKPMRFFTNALNNNELLGVAQSALERVGLEDSRHMVAAELSHGQRRQLEVAIALTLKPKAFIMDEPMAGLGSDGSKKLTNFLNGLRHEAPILLVEHDMDAVFTLADRISVLVYGKVIASGSVDDIRSNRDVKDAYLGEEA